MTIEYAVNIRVVQITTQGKAELQGLDHGS